MFFFIDEAGNTGNNLFDENQPRLSYGVLSSVVNVDALCQKQFNTILENLDVEQLHANELGVEKLSDIAMDLGAIQDRCKFDFDYYLIEKDTYALVEFYDSVFDAGLNEAVKWDWYWTPLRFLLIYQLSQLFDLPTLRESWRLCTHKRIQDQADEICSLLSTLLERSNTFIQDARAKEIIGDALEFGIARPLDLDFGSRDPKSLSPNAICFQFVVHCISHRLRKKKRKRVSKITVDQQQQFNSIQQRTLEYSRTIAEGIKNDTHERRNIYINHPLFLDFEENYFTRNAGINQELIFSSSKRSVGLQIVDVYLWIINRHFDNKELSPELYWLAAKFLPRSIIDGITLAGMAERFRRFEQKLPEFASLTEEQINLARQKNDQHRHKVESLRERAMETQK